MVFLQVCHHNPNNDFIHCVGFRTEQKVQLLLMFMTYCLETLGQQPPTISGIMSGLRHNFRARLIGDKAFDHPLVTSMKAGVSWLPYIPRTRVPCTFDMVQHIIYTNTQDGFLQKDFVKAVAVAMAYYLCLRSSEYVSKTSTLPSIWFSLRWISDRRKPDPQSPNA